MSTSLQLGLAAAGATVLAGLVLHNIWEAQKNRPRQAEAAADGEIDQAANDAAESDGSIQTNEPVKNAAVTAGQKVLNPLIDAIASIELDPDTTVAGAAALAAMPASRRVGDKPFTIEGRNTQSQEWEVLQAGAEYDAFQAGVQLANRSGALSDIGFSEFALKTQAFAEEVNGTPHFPDMIEEVARARDLDQFASANDARVGFVLRARAAAWSAGYLQQVAARLGFVAGSHPGKLVLQAEQKNHPPLLSLEFDTQAALAEDLEQSAVHEALLCLDIPQVAEDKKPYEQMCRIAQSLAKEMDGIIIDGNGLRLDPVAMNKIGQDISDVYLLLAQRDFHAGTPLTQRLFS